MLSDGDDQSIDDCQRQREEEGECGSLSLHGLNLDATTKLFNVLPDDVHAHAAPRDVRDFVRGREAGFEDELEDRGGRENSAFLYQTFLLRLLKNLGCIQPAAII